MKPTFNKGDVVVADVTAQGMVKGARYEVVGADWNALPWGNYFCYTLRAADGSLVTIVNGHLLLTVTCGVCAVAGVTPVPAATTERRNAQGEPERVCADCAEGMERE